MSALSAQNFMKKFPSKEVEINRTLTKFQAQTLPAPSPELILATRLGASRTLSISGLQLQDHPLETRELEIKMRKALGEGIIDVMIDEGFRDRYALKLSRW
jgi:hypothetical protein